MNVAKLACSAKVAMSELARFCANSAITTVALDVKLCNFIFKTGLHNYTVFMDKFDFEF